MDNEEKKIFRGWKKRDKKIKIQTYKNAKIQKNTKKTKNTKYKKDKIQKDKKILKINKDNKYSLILRSQSSFAILQCLFSIQKNCTISRIALTFSGETSLRAVSFAFPVENLTPTWKSLPT